MTTNRKLIAIPAVLAALAAAAPAAAQGYGQNHRQGYGQGYGQHRTEGDALRRDIAQLEQRLDRLDDTRRISGREEARLDRSIDGLKRTWSAYSRGGFNHGERRNLAAQIDRVRDDLDRQANDRNDRGRYRG